MSWARERRRDVSVGWPQCTECRRTHLPGASCPPVGVWLVLTLCPVCNARTGYYCNRHRGKS